MKLIVIKSNLKDGLDVVSRAAGENTPLPILKNVLVEAQDGKINLTATNLEVALNYVVSGKIIEPGQVTVPAAVFLNIISNLPSERLTIEAKNNSTEIKTDNYQAVLQGMPAEEFPLVPKIKNQKEFLEIKGDILKEALAQTAPSAQTNDLRPELNAVLLAYSGDEIILAATDSFRLAEKKLAASQYETEVKDPFRALVPLKTAAELARIIRDEDLVKIYRDANQILFAADRFRLTSRVLEGNFPDYAAILPQAFDTEIYLDRQELINALKLAGVFSSKVSEIKIRTSENNKSIEVFSHDQSGENNYLLPARVQGKPREISFNWRFLLDGLRALKTEDIFWGINEENKPALLRSPQDGSYFYVLMPILRA